MSTDRAGRWKGGLAKDRRVRLVPLSERGTDDQLAANPEELENRQNREIAMGCLEFLKRHGIADKVLKLPTDNPFYFSDLGVKGNDIPRLCYEGRIVKAARGAAGFRWAKVEWETTEYYPLFVEHMQTLSHMAKLRDHLPLSVSNADLAGVPDMHYAEIIRTALSNKLKLDDNVVRICRG